MGGSGNDRFDQNSLEGVAKGLFAERFWWHGDRCPVCAHKLPTTKSLNDIREAILSGDKTRLRDEAEIFVWHVKDDITKTLNMNSRIQFET